MLKIALIALISVPLFASFFPQTVHTSVKSVQGKTITLKSAFPHNGMSGVVIHDYGNNLTAITSRITQLSSNGKSVLLDAEVIDHDALPSIRTAVSSKDEIIGGYLYNNVLLLAPDADTYARIIASQEKRWIHPDLFAVYLSTIGDDIPNKENLASFAKRFQVGLVYIVRKDSAVLLDPISGKIVGQKNMTGLPQKGQFPFFMRFKSLNTGWFGFGSSAKGNFYDTMQSI